MAWYRTPANVLLSQPVRAEGDVEGCWQWVRAVIWRNTVCLADVPVASMLDQRVKMAVGVGVVFAHARDRPGYSRVYEGRHMRGRQGRWAVGRETQAGRGADSPEGGVQRRGVVDWVVVVVWSGVGDNSGGG
jgi:hypothetical protein